MNRAIEHSRNLLASMLEDARCQKIDKIRANVLAIGVEEHYRREVAFCHGRRIEGADTQEYRNYIKAMLGMF